MTLFDLIAFSLLAISGGVGFYRGAVREMMSVLALIVAAAGALWGLRVAGPIAREMMEDYSKDDNSQVQLDVYRRLRKMHHKQQKEARCSRSFYVNFY